VDLNHRPLGYEGDERLPEYLYDLNRLNFRCSNSASETPQQNVGCFRKAQLGEQISSEISTRPRPENQKVSDILRH
jgi:hypothetical protein